MTKGSKPYLPPRIMLALVTLLLFAVLSSAALDDRLQVIKDRLRAQRDQLADVQENSDDYAPPDPEALEDLSGIETTGTVTGTPVASQGIAPETSSEQETPVIVSTSSVY